MVVSLVGADCLGEDLADEPIRFADRGVVGLDRLDVAGELLLVRPGPTLRASSIIWPTGIWSHLRRQVTFAQTGAH